MKNNLPKDHMVSTRLSDPLYRRLGAYSRASGETKSGVIRSLIEKGYFRLHGRILHLRKNRHLCLKRVSA
ncbi:hypothetical protein [uncultured Duncaniella sp.]|uniref:hypothetical protein n=1 Tax=uncultured Duncaniella sp. TaxID=2768039 RepID=UPI00265916EA|nr:hypothetical protein [uncultured Duncaniella sp.]